MKITKAKLVDIIKEEITGLDEGIFDALKAAARPSTKGGYRAAGPRGAENPKTKSDRIDDEIAKLSSKCRQIAAAATMDANFHSDQKDVEQNRTIQALADRSESIYDILDTPEEIADNLLSNNEFIKSLLSNKDFINSLSSNSGFVNKLRDLLSQTDLFKTTFGPRIQDVVKKAMKTDQNKKFFDEALIDFLDNLDNNPEMITKIANKINQKRHSKE